MDFAKNCFRVKVDAVVLQLGFLQAQQQDEGDAVVTNLILVSLNQHFWAYRPKKKLTDDLGEPMLHLRSDNC